MKPRLHAVLGIRQHNEAEARRVLGVLERERADILAMRSAIGRDLDEAASANVRPELREQLAAFATACRAAAVACDQRTAACDGRINTARSLLANAHREVRAIEALQARDRASAARSASRREGRENDEFAARRHQETSR
jgi:flagellar FliJ protein